MSSFNHLLSKAKLELEKVLSKNPIRNRHEKYPACVLFFVVSNGLSRAHIEIATGDNYQDTWDQGVELVKKHLIRSKLIPVWLRVEVVHGIEALSWGDFKTRLERTKRNYFRFGIAFTPDFKTALLEHELYANAVLYKTDVSVATPNARNLENYTKKRFDKPLHWPKNDDHTIWRFKTRAVFTDGKETHTIERDGRNSGYRVIKSWDEGVVEDVIYTSTEYLSKQVKESGEYHYGWFPCFDRAIPTYNALRHASSTYALLEGWELTQDRRQKRAIDRSLDYLTHILIKKSQLPDGSTAAFLVDLGDEIKLGGNAVSILAYAKYTEITGDNKYLELMEQLALGIVFMQKSDTGQYVHILNYPDLSVKSEYRTIYYDGEAAFGLMRLYGITKDPRWLASVEKGFEYFIANNHWKSHDHWLSYCVNELTLYNPDPKYYKFGLDNIRDHLDFVLNRITTYPTLLELMMAAQRMIDRLQNDENLSYLLDDFDVDKFYEALEYRARYLMNGYFYPEVAMFFQNPNRILGSFFIRHHTFRVRIDDVEHYLSGYVAYLKYLQRQKSSDFDSIVAFGGDVNLGRRQHYRAAELGVDNVLNIPSLKNADLSIVNLECVISTIGEQGIEKGEGGPYYYRARPEMMEVLIQSGVDVVTVANNHSGDYGPEALMQQGEFLDSVGIGHVGSGVNTNEAFKPIYRTVNDTNIAIFSIDSTQHRFAATNNTPGAAYIPLKTPEKWEEILTPLIEQAKKAAHLVFVAVHWGDNRVAEPTELERQVAKKIINAGADAILGTSAHILQGLEIYNNKPIIYDAGDLLFDSVRRNLAASGLFNFEIINNRIIKIRFIPVGVGFGFSTELQGKKARLASENYQKLCQNFGTNLNIDKDESAYIELDPISYKISKQQKKNLFNHRKNNLNKKFNLYQLKLEDHAIQQNWIVDSVPEEAKIEPIDFNGMKLIGIKISPTLFTKREMLYVESFWTCDVSIKENRRIGFRAVPTEVSKMPAWGTGMDHDPCDWMMPTSQWESGVIYRDFYGLRSPYLKNWVNGRLQVEVEVISGSKRKLVKLPIYVTLAISGKGSVPIYNMEFPEIIQQGKKNQTWTAEQLAAVTGGKWSIPPPDEWYVNSIVAGKKHIGLLPSPTLFIGHDSYDRQRHEQTKMPFENFNRHNVIIKNLDNLAGAIVSEKLNGLPKEFPVLFVPDGIKAMIELGLAARSRFDKEVIAVTGTAGKSTTLGMLQAMFGGKDRAFASVDNYNSRVGAPSMLANLSTDHEAAIIEVAQSALWMKRGPITQLIKPTIALITEVGVSQTDTRVKSVYDTAKWKSRVFNGLTGVAIAVVGEHLDYFDYIMAQAEKYAKRVVVFGKSDQADVQIVSIELKEAGSWVCIKYDGNLLNFYIPLPGIGMVHNAVASATVLYALGRDVKEGTQLLKNFEASEGRMQKQIVKVADKKIEIIDDSFNATVTSMINALSVLSNTSVENKGRKIAVLGRIVHLGDLAESLHRSLLNHVFASGAELVITHGDEMKYLRDVLPIELLGPHFSDAISLVNYLKKVLRNNDLVLLKGSRRNSDFGEIINCILNHE